MSKLLTVATLAASLVAASASAQQAAAPAGPQLSHGPAIPGVCVFSESAAIGSSSAGRAVGTRLQALGQAVQAELQPERTTIESEAKAVQAIADKNSDAYRTRGTNLQNRLNAFQQKTAVRTRELEVTQQKQLVRIAQEMQPIVATVYGQRKCSVLLNGEAAFAANPAMDITDAVVQQLNAKLPTLTFDRERLEQQAAAPAAPR